MAAMAWAPPIRYTSSMASRAAAASVAWGTLPSGPGGTHRAISGTPATWAGMAVISTVDGYTARPVAPGPVDRPDQVADDDPLPLVAGLLLHLGAVVGHDLVAGELQRLPEAGREGGQGVGQVAAGDAQVLQLDAVEPGSEVAQRLVAPLADVGDDL